MTHAPSTALLILGMHRSGTSALARVCNLAGAFLSEPLVPPRAEKQDNPTGFWELQEAVWLNDGLLNALGSDYLDGCGLPENWQNGPAAEVFLPRIHTLLMRHFTNQPLWLLKDPRLSRLLPLWLRAMQERHIAPVCAFSLRHPVEIAASLWRRNGIAPQKTYLVWLRHVLDAERATRDIPRAWVCYETLLDAPLHVLHRLHDELGVAWPIDPHTQDKAIAGFIAPELKHFRVDDLKGSIPPMPVVVRQAWDIVRMAGLGQSAIDTHALDTFQQQVQQQVDRMQWEIAQ